MDETLVDSLSPQVNWNTGTSFSNSCTVPGAYTFKVFVTNADSNALSAAYPASISIS